MLLAAAGCTPEAPAPAQRQNAADPVASFLASHWARPFQAQGGVLDPASCGACHQAQYEDWRGSLHSGAMGPGLVGQLAGMDAAERDDCQRCHAPLKEQADTRSPLFAQGLVCAACHMRGDRVYGPPRRDGSMLASAESFPHGGWTASGAFADARFCATCHQFEQDGYALNGKLLENTYQEWNASRHAREGRPCQACHMPDRRHLWRGIHDREMTRSGITVTASTPQVDAGGEIKAAWRLTNSGTGHYFPTYVTPRIVVTIRQETANGQALRGTARESVIARQIKPDLTVELSDTRIAPDEERVFEYKAGRDPRATHLTFRIRVEPDAFYTGLYRSLLEDRAAAIDRPLIAEALRRSLASRYVLYEDRQPLQLIRNAPETPSTTAASAPTTPTLPRRRGTTAE